MLAVKLQSREGARVLETYICLTLWKFNPDPKNVFVITYWAAPLLGQGLCRVTGNTAVGIVSLLETDTVRIAIGTQRYGHEQQYTFRSVAPLMIWSIR